MNFENEILSRLQSILFSLGGTYTVSNSNPTNFKNEVLRLLDAIEPSVSPFPSPSSQIIYSVSQSSVDQSYTGTYANLTDNNLSTGLGTQSNNPAWIQIDFGGIYFLESIQITGGSMPGWGSVASYFAGASLRLSADGANYFLFPSTLNISDTIPTRWSFSYPQVRYLRFERSGYLGFCEFRAYGFPT